MSHTKLTIRNNKLVPFDSDFKSKKDNENSSTTAKDNKNIDDTDNTDSKIELLKDYADFRPPGKPLFDEKDRENFIIRSNNKAKRKLNDKEKAESIEKSENTKKKKLNDDKETHTTESKNNKEKKQENTKTTQDNKRKWITIKSLQKKK